jgi:hypothetical protein
VVIWWTHCHGRASDRDEKRNSPGTRENRGPEETKNSTNEASKLMKKRIGGGNEAKKYTETKELYKNIGKEAKKLLKTKHIALSSGAAYARVARKLIQI